MLTLYLYGHEILIFTIIIDNRRGNRFVPKANVIGIPSSQIRSRSRSISPSSGQFCIANC